MREIQHPAKDRSNCATNNRLSTRIINFKIRLYAVILICVLINLYMSAKQLLGVLGVYLLVEIIYQRVKYNLTERYIDHGL